MRLLSVYIITFEYATYPNLKKKFTGGEANVKARVDRVKE